MHALQACLFIFRYKAEIWENQQKAKDCWTEHFCSFQQCGIPSEKIFNRRCTSGTAKCPINTHEHQQLPLCHHVCQQGHHWCQTTRITEDHQCYVDFVLFFFFCWSFEGNEHLQQPFRGNKHHSPAPYTTCLCTPLGWGYLHAWILLLMLEGPTGQNDLDFGPFSSFKSFLTHTTFSSPPPLYLWMLL